MTRAVLYARYSSDNQREESIDAQVRAITEYADKNGYTIAHAYVDEALSAKTDNRPQFMKMISDAKKQLFDIVICHKLDRFARNRYDSAIYKKILRDNGVRLISVSENFDNSPESIILESVLEGMAEYYSANLAREVMKGLKENALQCKHTGGKPPFGYDVLNKEYVINQHEAIAVKQIFKMTMAGQSYVSVRNWLKDNGYRTKYNSDFSSRSINEILKNEKYIGIYVYNKKKRIIVNGKTQDIKHNHDEIIRIENGVPAIIDQESFYQVDQILKGRLQRGFGSSRAKETYLLSGKLFCGECGGYMNGSRFHGGSNKHLYIVYECSNRKQKKNNCIKSIVNRDKLEKHVIDELDKYLFADGVNSEVINNLSSYVNELFKQIPNDIKQYEAELSGITRQIDNIVNAIANGMFHSSMKTKLDELESQRDIIVARIDEAQRQLKAFSAPDKRKIELKLSNHKNLYSKSPEQKRAAIEAYIKKATVYNDGRVDIEIDLSRLYGAEPYCFVIKSNLKIA